MFVCGIYVEYFRDRFDFALRQEEFMVLHSSCIAKYSNELKLCCAPWMSISWKHVPRFSSRLSQILYHAYIIFVPFFRTKLIPLTIRHAESFVFFVPQFIERFSSETKRKCWSFSGKWFHVEKSQKACEGTDPE